jgi:AcrR family transcriptional regulator
VPSGGGGPGSARADTVSGVGGLVELENDPTVDDAQRRGRILGALATCMAEKGYRATTVADIARVARVSKTVLYAHFQDKEDCLLELVSRATDKVLDGLRRTQQESAAAGLPWRDRVRATVSALLSALASGPEVAWAVLVEVQAAGRSGLALRRHVLDRYVALLCETADDLVARFPDEVRPVDEELVLAAVGGIHELMLARVERGQAARITEDTDVAAAVLVGLLERRG